MTKLYRVKHVSEPAEPGDGCRVLVDRLWPRGVRKIDLVHDFWLKEVAPSHELRKWFGHEPARWDDFRQRYAAELDGAELDGAELDGAELDGKGEQLERLRGLAKAGPVTLLFSARDRARNQAVALRDYLNR